MKLYNPILKGKYIREIPLDIDKSKEVSEEEGKRLMKEYPFLLDLDSPKSKPSYIDRPLKKKETPENQIIKRLDKIIQLLETKRKKTIWHTIKSKIL